MIRFIFACAYDLFVTSTDRNILLPDEKFYSMRGRYVSILLNGYDKDNFTKDMLPADRTSREIFDEILRIERGRFPPLTNETNLYSYLIGVIYFIFGYFPLAVRVFNILLSIGSTYLIFRIAKRRFGELAANLFLIVALFLPTQFGYSITLSRDFVRVFVVCLTLWVIYG